MSWQAIEAVQDHSNLNGSDQATGLLLMQSIARFCDASGVSGRVKRTAVSIETIAEKAHVTKRTVLNWLPKLEATGELTVERNGKGRGAWNQYTINLPMASNGEPQGSPLPVDNLDNGERNGERNGEPQGSPLTTQELLLMVNELHLMVKGMVNNGEPQGSPDTEIDTEIDTEKPKNIYIPGSTEPKGDIHHQEYLPEPVQEFVTALQLVCKTPYLFGHERNYHEAAYYLHGEDASKEDIPRFGEWWSRYGFYEGQPALKTIVDSWRNFKNGVVPNAKVASRSKRNLNNQIPAEYADVIKR